jgi:sulfite reductase alpha subunit-like flavoprotein
VKVAFNAQEWTTRWGSKRRGVATGYLEKAEDVRVFPRSVEGVFTVPEDAGDVVLVASGTGITPFRGFLEARARQPVAERKGKWWLVYGCRFPGKDGDAVYMDEVEGWLAEGVLDRLDVVCSRDAGASRFSAEVAESDKAAAKYVQHVLRLHSGDLHAFLEDEKSVVYVCGDAKTMGKGVSAALGEIWEEKEGWKVGEGVEYWLEKRAEEGGFRRDVWG